MFKEGSACGVCSSLNDGSGNHQVGTNGNGDRIHHHDSLRGILLSASPSDSLAPGNKVSSLIPNSQPHPEDVYHPHWKRGQPATLEITVISSLQTLLVKKATTFQGHNVIVGEERKLKPHSTACHSPSISFIPLVVECTGGWSSLAIDTIKAIGKHQGQGLGLPPSNTIDHLFKRLSIALC